MKYREGEKQQRRMQKITGKEYCKGRKETGRLRDIQRQRERLVDEKTDLQPKKEKNIKR